MLPLRNKIVRSFLAGSMFGDFDFEALLKKPKRVSAFDCAEYYMRPISRLEQVRYFLRQFLNSFFKRGLVDVSFNIIICKTVNKTAKGRVSSSRQYGRIHAVYLIEDRRNEITERRCLFLSHELCRSRGGPKTL